MHFFVVVSTKQKWVKLKIIIIIIIIIIKKKQEKILNEEIKPNDAWASKLLSFFSKTWTDYNAILWSRFPKVNINLTSKVQEI